MIQKNKDWVVACRPSHSWRQFGAVKRNSVRFCPFFCLFGVFTSEVGNSTESLWHCLSVGRSLQARGSAGGGARAWEWQSGIPFVALVLSQSTLDLGLSQSTRGLMVATALGVTVLCGCRCPDELEIACCSPPILHEHVHEGSVQKYVQKCAQACV